MRRTFHRIAKNGIASLKWGYESKRYFLNTKAGSAYSGEVTFNTQGSLSAWVKGDKFQPLAITGQDEYGMYSVKITTL